jgi:hypothetical protein
VAGLLVGGLLAALWPTAGPEHLLSAQTKQFVALQRFSQIMLGIRPAQSVRGLPAGGLDQHAGQRRPGDDGPMRGLP